MRLGFLGTGEIAAAMLRGLKGQGHDIRVSPRNAEMARILAAEMPGVRIAPNEEVVAGSEVVFLCLLARVAWEVLPGLPFRADHKVISVMVDAPLARLRAVCAPAADIAIAIPLPPIAQGGCPLPVYPASPVLETLYGARNPVLPQPSEAALAAHLGVSAICAPILDQLLAAADWLAGFTGDPRAAEAHVAAMIRAYLPQRAQGGDMAAALAGLSTEGGLNATLRAAMRGARDDLRRGLDGFRDRLGLPEGGA
ncbi:Pyrroline-5-carboxylate reductase [Rubellimicrobium thermophilum DSM 16684]|uniref:Pyrroline-5-carboxylate reductase n=1 Tax=Rubellimicrobium thermophilum DSM 16684 TaxID=1123069 RepID=S9R6X6_9RHOB|nr:NAD(P)-binding domain-containing protein [Rubellimicrobium thermophilum]EPX87622.1 Pyrroline-5-carboxylate reductase [Rubellimicrobium thermophilum DSM 16684]